MRNHQGCKRDLRLRDRDETETFGFLSETRPRPSKIFRDRDETETFDFWARDETETLQGRDRDVFRDLPMKLFYLCNYVQCCAVVLLISDSIVKMLLIVNVVVQHSLYL